MQKNSITRLEDRRFDEIKTQTGTVTGMPNGKNIIIKMNNGKYAEIPLLGIKLFNGECESKIAREKLISLVKNSVVSIESDENGSCCIIRKEKQDIGAWMLWNGFARADNNLQFSKLNEYISHEKHSKNAKRGLWGEECKN